MSEPGNYTVYIPYYDSDEFRSNIKVISGQSDICFKEISANLSYNFTDPTIPNISYNEYTMKVMKITSSDNLTVRCEHKSRLVSDWTMVGIDRDWCAWHWVWSNNTNPFQNISLKLVGSVDFRNGDTYSHTGSDDFNVDTIEIKPGWDIINMIHSTVVA